jgi:hypothetical protein
VQLITRIKLARHKKTLNNRDRILIIGKKSPSFNVNQPKIKAQEDSNLKLSY